LKLGFQADLDNGGLRSSERTPVPHARNRCT
jgi:hypothetical protein